MTHARLRGRCFRLTLAVDAPDTLRIEVTDPRGDRLPRSTVTASSADAEGGRGLLLVEALASRWGITPYPPSGKTVWACLPLPWQTDPGQSVTMPSAEPHAHALAPSVCRPRAGRGRYLPLFRRISVSRASPATMLRMSSRARSLRQRAVSPRKAALAVSQFVEVPSSFVASLKGLAIKVPGMDSSFQRNLACSVGPLPQAFLPGHVA